MQTVTLESVSYNVESYGEQMKNGLTEKLFVERGLSEGKYKEFPRSSRTELLKNAYRLIKEQSKKGTV